MQPELRAAIVQDAETSRVLMLAWMDDEALRLTRETGEAHFFSRSRRQLWRKGETSGNTLAVEELRDDCDGDAILLRVRPAGPACHTGALSCFAPWLWRRVAERRSERPEGSYVAGLVAAGPAAAARKVGEEGVEAALAGAAESDERLVEEIADLWFHTYVLLAARGLDPARRGRAGAAGYTVTTILPRECPSPMCWSAPAISSRGYVLSITDVSFPDSMSARRVPMSSLLNFAMKNVASLAPRIAREPRPDNVAKRPEQTVGPRPSDHDDGCARLEHASELGRTTASRRCRYEVVALAAPSEVLDCGSR